MAYVSSGLQFYFDGKDYPDTSTSTTWADKSGNNRNAALSGFTFDKTTSGWNGQGLVFESTDDKGVITGYCPISQDTDHTFEILFSSTSNAVIDLVGYGTSGQRWYVAYQNTQFWIGVGADRFYSNDIALTPNTKYHLVFRRNKATNEATLFINGAIHTTLTQAITGTISTTTNYFQLGTNYSGTTGNPKTIYLARWYNRPLSDSEVTQNYNDVTSGLQVHLDGADFTNSPQTTVLTDRSGKGNNAAVTNFSYTTSSGSDGNGYIKYDNVNDNMKVTQNATINNLGTFTMEFDIKLGASVTGNPRLADKSASGTCGWQVYLNTGTAGNYYPSITYYQSGGTQYELYSATSLALNSTYHISVDIDTTVYPYSLTKIYINNVSQTLTMAGGSVSGTYLTDSTADLHIGNRSDNARPFGNSLKNVKLYNKVLTTTERTQNYNDSLGAAGTNVTVIATAGASTVNNTTPIISTVRNVTNTVVAAGASVPTRNHSILLGGNATIIATAGAATANNTAPIISTSSTVIVTAATASVPIRTHNVSIDIINTVIVATSNVPIRTHNIIADKSTVNIVIAAAASVPTGNHNIAADRSVVNIVTAATASVPIRTHNVYMGTDKVIPVNAMAATVSTKTHNVITEVYLVCEFNMTEQNTMVNVMDSNVSLLTLEKNLEVVVIALQGDTIKLQVQFRDYNGKLFDPDTITLKVYQNTNQLLDTQTVSSGEKISTGIYEHLYTVPTGSGSLVYEFTGTVNGKPNVIREKITREWVR